MSNTVVLRKVYALDSNTNLFMSSGNVLVTGEAGGTAWINILSTLNYAGGDVIGNLPSTISTLSSLTFSNDSTLTFVYLSTGKEISDIKKLVETSITPLYINSTIDGLGTFGYVSTAEIDFLGSLGYVSSASVESTLDGLGTSGYVSSFDLWSTIDGLGQATYVSSASLESTLDGLGTAGYIIDTNLQSTVDGLNTFGYINQSNVTSTVNGLGIIGYVSTPSIVSTVIGLGTLGYLSSAALVGFVTSGQQVSTTEGLGNAGYVSSLTLATSLTSSIQGLGRIGYISTQGLLSTTAGLGTASYVSSAGLNTALNSTTAGLGTASYVSSPQLLSTVLGLGTATYVSSPQLLSTVLGLGTATYVSSPQLLSTTAGLGTATYVSSAGLNTALNSTTAGLGTATYVSSPQLLSTTAGLGTATYVSSAGLNTALNSTTAGLGTASYVSSPQLLSTVVGLGTASYVSSAGLNTALNSTTAGLGTATYVSSAGLNTALNSTTAGLGTATYVSSAGLNTALNSTTAGLGTATYVSSPQLLSTTAGLGTATYVSSAGLNTALNSTTAGLGTATYVSSSQLLSTVLGLGTATYVSSAGLNTALNSTTAGLGTASYVSSSGLISTVTRLVSNFSTGQAVASSVGVGIAAPVFNLDVIGSTRSRLTQNNSTLTIQSANGSRGKPYLQIFDQNISGDANDYGMLQLTRAQSTLDSNFHLSFIKQGSRVFGAGFLPSTAIFSLQYDFNGNSNGLFFANSTLGINTVSPQGTLDVNGITRSIVFSSLTQVTSSIGIGNNAPLYALDVAGRTRIASTLLIGNSVSTNAIRFSGTNADSPGSFNRTVIAERVFAASESSELLFFKGDDNEGSFGPDRVRVLATGGFQVDIASNNSAYDPDTQTVPTPASTSAFIVTPSGRVGVGLSNPTTQFDVAGTTRSQIVSSLTEVTSSIGVGTNTPVTTLDVAGTTRSQIVSSLTEVTSSIGIGTNTPVTTLDVAGTTRSQIVSSLTQVTSSLAIGKSPASVPLDTRGAVNMTLNPIGNSTFNFSIFTASSSYPSAQMWDSLTNDGSGYGLFTLTREQTRFDNRHWLTFIRRGSYVSGIGYVGSNTNTLGIVNAGTMDTNLGIFITSTSNVGIMTSNPSFTLDVAGTTRSQIISSLTQVTSSIGIGNNAPVYALDVAGRTRIASTLLIGNSVSTNAIRFFGTNNDGPGSFNHTVIAERIFAANEASELLFFKGNDVGDPDRVRVLTAGGFQVDIASNTATYDPDTQTAPTPVSTSAFIVAPSGRVGVGLSNPTTQLDVRGTIRGTSTIVQTVTAIAHSLQTFSGTSNTTFDVFTGATITPRQSGTVTVIVQCSFQTYLSPGSGPDDRAFFLVNGANTELFRFTSFNQFDDQAYYPRGSDVPNPMPCIFVTTISAATQFKIRCFSETDDTINVALRSMIIQELSQT